MEIMLFVITHPDGHELQELDLGLEKKKNKKNKKDKKLWCIPSAHANLLFS